MRLRSSIPARHRLQMKRKDIGRASAKTQLRKPMPSEARTSGNKSSKPLEENLDKTKEFKSSSSDLLRAA